MVGYTYDAWGNLLSTTGSMASTLGTANPLRYRGYVYDTETGLYYLQSRYYNPEIGRFICSDTLFATGQGLFGNNMYAYCLNNPVCMVDHEGYDAIYVVDYSDEYGVPIVGHAFLYIQDANGEWYISEFAGPNKRNASIRLEKAKMTYISQMIDGKNIEKIEYLYIEGDFSNSINLASYYAGTNYGGYNLLRNNCQHYAHEILKAGNFDDKSMERAVRWWYSSVIPRVFIRKLKLFSLMKAIKKEAKNHINEIFEFFTRLQLIF